MSKQYDVYGIGNALVDIVTEVDRDFFLKNEIEKGVMTLVDEKRQHHLIHAIDMKKSKMYHHRCESIWRKNILLVPRR